MSVNRLAQQPARISEAPWRDYYTNLALRNHSGLSHRDTEQVRMMATSRAAAFAIEFL